MPGEFIQPSAQGVRLFVRVSPRASRDRIEGIERDAAGQERLRIRVTAPPDKGEANSRVIELLAKALHIAKSSMAVRQGAQDRNKSLDIAGDTQQLMASLKALTGEGI
jgi:hypothetical protein